MSDPNDYIPDWTEYDLYRVSCEEEYSDYEELRDREENLHE
jgi:hypothetical protein